MLVLIKVSKGAKIRNRYNQAKLSYNIYIHKIMTIRAKCGEQRRELQTLWCQCNKYFSIDNNVMEAANTLKGTFLSLVNCGLIHPEIYTHYHEKI